MQVKFAKYSFKKPPTTTNPGKYVPYHLVVLCEVNRHVIGSGFYLYTYTLEMFSKRQCRRNIRAAALEIDLIQEAALSVGPMIVNQLPDVPMADVPAAVNDDEWAGVAAESDDEVGESDSDEWSDEEEEGVEEFTFVTDKLEKDESEIFLLSFRKWVFSTSQSVASVNSLLRVIGTRIPCLPKTFATLMSTPKESVNTRVIKSFVGPKKVLSPGSYAHYGIQKYLLALNHPVVDSFKTITIDIGVDGASLSQSSNLTIWPILGIICEQDHHRDRQHRLDAFTIGMYVGKGKPHSTCEFCLDFCDEIDVLLKDGVLVGSDPVRRPFRINAFICDAPARAFLTGVHHHGHQHACPRCTGERAPGNPTNYPVARCEPRTDDSFRRRIHIGHHREDLASVPSRLELSGIPHVSKMVLDPMHLVDIGFGKGILKAACGRKIKGGPHDMEIFKSTYQSYFHNCPSDFARKPRSLNEVTHFKATEGRQFLLYLGMVLFKDSMDKETYEHFLLLVCAYRLLAVDVTDHNLQVAQQLLDAFVARYTEFYPKDSIRFNVHCLLHLPEIAKEFGNLSSVTAYRFENHIRKLKNVIKSNTNILQQMNNRITEQYVHNYFPERTFKDKIVKAGLRDSAWILGEDSSIVVVQEYDKKSGKVVAIKFATVGNFFEYPMPSSDLGIFMVCGQGEVIDLLESQLSHKCYLLPHGSSFVVIPLLIMDLHTCT